MNEKGEDLAPRNGSGWSVAAVALQMKVALEKSGVEIPLWLDLLARESEAKLRGVETAVFGMT